MCSWRLVYETPTQWEGSFFPWIISSGNTRKLRCLTKFPNPSGPGWYTNIPHTDTHTRAHAWHRHRHTHLHIHVHNIKTEIKIHTLCVKQKFSSHVIECEKLGLLPSGKHVLCRHWAWRKEKWKQFSSFLKNWDIIYILVSDVVT